MKAAGHWGIRGVSQKGLDRHGCALQREIAQTIFYNENYKSNPFGNLIDDRVYLSMWF